MELQRQVDGAALAAEYHLGVPQKRHTLNLDTAVGIGCSAVLIAVYLLVLLTIAELVWQNQSVIGWIVLVLGLLLTLRMVLFLIDLNKASFPSSIAYECSEGFVVVSGHGKAKATQVLIALRWDKITRVWKEREKATGRRNPVRQVRYYVCDREGRQYTILHVRIWRRARKELASRSHRIGKPPDW